MARGINKVIVVGNLGGDPDVRYTGSGAAITTINVATTEQWTSKKTGEPQSHAEWHRVKLFGKLAEIAGEYLKKGRQVYVEGSLRTDKYTDKDGIERYTTNIVANDMQMLGGAPGGDNTRGGSGYGGASSGHNGQSFGHNRGRQRQQPSDEPPPAPPGETFDDDDIPF